MTSYLVVYLLGVLFGGIAVKLFGTHKHSGNIIVTSDEDGTYLSLELKRLEDVTTKQEVTFGVITRN